jgi:membrane-associated protein
MEIITFFIDFIIHLDEHLHQIITTYGTWSYGILFLVIFLETGVVVTPFLPGDSLLFAAGAIASLGAFNPLLLWVLLFAAAVIGDGVNYTIGNKIGERILASNTRLIKREHIEKTEAFYEKHGGKTIVLARFVPIIRTFAPFVAGIGSMQYRRFATFNVLGAFLWTSIFISLGYFFGNLPIVKDNFSAVIFGIIFISLLPIFYEYGRELLERRRAVATE